MGDGAHVSIRGMKEAQATFTRLAVLSERVAKEEVEYAIQAVRTHALRLTSQPGTGRIYKRKSVLHQASSPYDPPATDLRGLQRALSNANAITYDHGGLRAEYGPRNYPIAVYLEYGTRHMLPRPFLFRSLEETRPKFVADMQKAMRKLEDVR